MTDLVLALTVAAALGCAAMGGLFFAFSTFVMQALARIPAAAGIAAMQSINAVILNPWFFGLFFGTAAACAVVIAAAVLDWTAASPWRAVGGALYLLGAIGVTIVRNVPLNQALDAVPPDAPEAPERWADYGVRWTRWNHVRTVACLAAAAALIVAVAKAT